MKLAPHALLPCLAAAVALSTHAAAAVQQPAESQSLEGPVDAYLKPYLDTGNFSGSILVARDGKVLLSKGYGLANTQTKTPNGPRTSYYLASTSRIFTSAAILLLEQRGELFVDDPLSEYLPDWPRGDEITLHHLLTLSAGFPNINEMSGYGMWSQSPQTPASLCEKFRDLPLEFAPGARSVHSNSNYNLLALLIETVSEQPFGEFLEQEIFAPLGMQQTAHDADSKQPVPGRAVGYAPVGLAKLGPAPSLQWSVKTGNGSIYSTTEDLFRFDRMLVARSLLTEASVEKTFQEHFPSNGYGWFVGRRSGATEVSVTGRSPGFGSSWLHLDNPDVTVIVLGNIYNGVPGTVARDLLAMTLGESVPPSPLRADPPDPALLQELVGAYQFGPDFYRRNAKVSFHQREGHLFNGPSWLIPAGEMTFIHRTYWSKLRFQRDESGAIHRLQYDNFIGERVR